MPIPIFNSIAWQHYDGIAYFFSKSDKYYQGDEDHIRKQIQRLVNTTNCIIVDVVTASAGGPLGMILEGELITGTKLIASPPVLRNEKCTKLLMDKDFSALKNAKILFSSACAWDTRHYSFIKDILPEDLFCNVVHDVSKHYNKHSTLIYAAHSGILTQFMSS